MRLCLLVVLNLGISKILIVVIKDEHFLCKGYAVEIAQFDKDWAISKEGDRFHLSHIRQPTKGESFLMYRDLPKRQKQK